jgi:hypothetical protein
MSEGKNIFVGSSTEGRPVAEQMIANLKAAGLNPLPWFDFFKSDRAVLQELEYLTLRSQGAVLVATADDRVVVRANEQRQMRDNVLLEYGLFSGALGRAKCALLVPDEAAFRIPSDFLGVACLRHYQKFAIDEACAAVAASLALVLERPPPIESVQSRGRRLLGLIGWMRDELSNLGQGLNEGISGTKRRIEQHIAALSAFLREDIDWLGLRTEYNKLEAAVLTAVRDFPEKVSLNVEVARRTNRPARLSDEYEYESSFSGDIADRLIAGVPFDGMVRKALMPVFSFGLFSGKQTYKRWKAARKQLNVTGSYASNHRFDPSPTTAQAWAYGAAEAVELMRMIDQHFDKMARDLALLHSWSSMNMPNLNRNIAAFEKQLHEVLFAPL